MSILEHKFTKYCYDKHSLVNGVNNLSTFCRRLEKQALSNPSFVSYEDYTGWGFECFGEALIKLSPCDKRIGIYDYRPLPIDELDLGVDGYGISVINGRPATVQFKYRSNSTAVLTANADHLTNFLSTSQNRYGVRVDDKDNMLIITTGKELHFFTENEMLHGKVDCIGWDELKDLVDDNFGFWDNFRRNLERK